MWEKAHLTIANSDNNQAKMLPIKLIFIVFFYFFFAFCTSLFGYKSLFLEKIHWQNYCCYVKSKSLYFFLTFTTAESSQPKRKTTNNHFLDRGENKTETSTKNLKVVILGERLKGWLLSQCEGNKHFHFQLGLLLRYHKNKLFGRKTFSFFSIRRRQVVVYTALFPRTNECQESGEKCFISLRHLSYINFT